MDICGVLLVVVVGLILLGIVISFSESNTQQRRRSSIWPSYDELKERVRNLESELDDLEIDDKTDWVDRPIEPLGRHYRDLLGYIAELETAVEEAQEKDSSDYDGDGYHGYDDYGDYSDDYENY